MNREIEFRGKAFTELTDKWVYGNLLLSETPISGQPKAFIVIRFADSENVAKVEVDPSTVGQFTGLRDKDRKRIYEGDIMRYPAKNKWELDNYSCFEVFFHDGDAHREFNIGYSMSRMHNHGSIGGGMTPSFKPKTVSKMIVIGNIHDNPELTKFKTKSYDN